MKQPHFTWCNHGCRSRTPVGMATNGLCRFPHDLAKLKEVTNLMQSSHHDPEVRKFARQVSGLLDHIIQM